MRINIHSFTDRFCRRLALMSTGGQTVDSTAGALPQRPTNCRSCWREGYDGDTIRRQIEAAGPAMEKQRRLQVACLYEIIYLQGFIDLEQRIARSKPKTKHFTGMISYLSNGIDFKIDLKVLYAEIQNN